MTLCEKRKRETASVKTKLNALERLKMKCKGKNRYTVRYGQPVKHLEIFWLGVVVHSYNPSNSRGGGRKISVLG
jgi:hypothetical protein